MLLSLINMSSTPEEKICLKKKKFKKELSLLEICKVLGRNKMKKKK